MKWKSYLLEMQIPTFMVITSPLQSILIGLKMIMYINLQIPPNNPLKNATQAAR